MNEEQYAKIVADLASNETEHSSFKRRLDEHDTAIREQNKIFIALEKQSSAIESMNTSMNRVEDKVDGISKRVDTLEQEPGERWKKITWEIVKYVVLALIGVAVGWVIKNGGV
jgi:chromosome segregation ATPase